VTEPTKASDASGRRRSRQGYDPAVAVRLEQREGTNRILTVPNVVTVVRLLCLPVFLWLLFVADDYLSAGLLLGALGVTDFVDGYVARHFNQVSDVGKVLDPVADRLLFIVGVGGIMIAGAAPAWFSVAVLVREVAVGAAIIVLSLLGMKRFDVSWWGKAGTLALMVAFPSFLLSEADFRLAGLMRVVAWGFGIPGLVLSYYAAITYIPVMRRNLVEGRAARQGAPS
jgi:cardiolipin synthase